VHLTLGDLRLGFSWRAAGDFFERAVRHAQALRVTEVVLVELDAAVVAGLEQMIFDFFDVLRFAIRRETHHPLLAAVHSETRVVGKGAVEQAGAVWIAKLLQQCQLVSFSNADGTGGPFADAVDGEYRSFVERRWVKRTRGMTLVVIAEE